MQLKNVNTTKGSHRVTTTGAYKIVTQYHSVSDDRWRAVRLTVSRSSLTAVKPPRQRLSKWGALKNAELSRRVMDSLPLAASWCDAIFVEGPTNRADRYYCFFFLELTVISLLGFERGFTCLYKYYASRNFFAGEYAKMIRWIHCSLTP